MDMLLCDQCYLFTPAHFQVTTLKDIIFEPENGVSHVLSSFIKTCSCCSFQAYGMSALPLNLIKGTRNAAYERLENTEDIEEVEQHIQAIRSKVSSWLVIGSTELPCLCDPS